MIGLSGFESLIRIVPNGETLCIPMINWDMRSRSLTLLSGASPSASAIRRGWPSRRTKSNVWVMRLEGRGRRFGNWYVPSWYVVMSARWSSRRGWRFSSSRKLCPPLETGRERPRP